MEDITHLKYTMDDRQIDQYIEDWISDNAINLIVELNYGKKIPVPSGKTLPLKKTYHLKVTVEKEEITV